jgi:hypothetical protein
MTKQTTRPDERTSAGFKNNSKTVNGKQTNVPNG